MSNWNGNGRGGNGCGCNLLNNLSRTLNNLFSTGSNNNNGCCNCGCNQNGWNTFANGFVSGVNAANASEEWWGNNDHNHNGNGCGCNGNQGGGNGTATVNVFGGNTGNCPCGCGSSADLSAYTACGNQCYDAYYAQQYGLYPFNQNCSCGYGF